MPVMKKWCLAVGIFTILAVFDPSAMGQPQSDPASVKLVKVNAEVYFVEGPTQPAKDAAGNSGIIIGSTGVIVIDAKSTADLGKVVLADIAQITSKPVTHVILTHSDADHVNGIAAFPTGLTIIAQENNKKEQEAALSAGGPAAP